MIVYQILLLFQRYYYYYQMSKNTTQYEPGGVTSSYYWIICIMLHAIIKYLVRYKLIWQQKYYCCICPLLETLLLCLLIFWTFGNNNIFEIMIITVTIGTLKHNLWYCFCSLTLINNDIVTVLVVTNMISCIIMFSVSLFWVWKVSLSFYFCFYFLLIYDS